MHWDLRHARIFVAVSEELSFSGAAQRLNTTQSAISRSIAGMEADLGVALLGRTTRNVQLTPEGRLLLGECRHIVAQFDRWIRRARSVSAGLAGELSIGCNDFAIQAELPVIVKAFRSIYPDVTLRFRSTTAASQFAAL